MISEKRISTLHFLTPQPVYQKSFFELIESALIAGINWIQYRDKENDDELFLKIATETFSICKKHNATFIINDKVEIAKTIDADGVHVGQNDLSIIEARTILGYEKIIGLSTNNLQQIIEAQNNSADYVGLGPFQFTSTRKNLNPIVGLNGFEKIIGNDFFQENNFPVVAIGGINETNIIPLKQIGVKGFAISSAISSAKNPIDAIKKLQQKVGVFHF